MFGIYFGYFIFKFLVKLLVNDSVDGSVIPAQDLFLLSEAVQFTYLLILIGLVDREYRWSKSITGGFLIIFAFFEFLQSCLKLLDLKNYSLENGQDALSSIIMRVEFFHYLLFPYQFVIFGLGIYILFIQNGRKV